MASQLWSSLCHVPGYSTLVTVVVCAPCLIVSASFTLRLTDIAGL